MEYSKNGHPVFPEVELYRHAKRHQQERAAKETKKLNDLSEVIDNGIISLIRFGDALEAHTAAVNKNTAVMEQVLKELRGIKGRL